MSGKWPYRDYAGETTMLDATTNRARSQPGSLVANVCVYVSSDGIFSCVFLLFALWWVG